jgi:phosphate ABC transporter phosphate-binding protein
MVNPARAAASHVLIEGSGSTWSSNAVNQWIADVNAQGIQVVFTANGSSQGRKDFANGITDFGVSEIPYQGVDELGNSDVSNRKFSYLPIVAGGTSFTYQIKVGGQLVRNLRLSGETIAKIFTNQITNWNDPQVTADNNGRKLPSLAIIPVVRSDGSGTTAQFTKYLDTMYPSIWRAYNGRAGLVSYYPRKGQQIAQNGSDQVMNYVSSGAANGAIGYVEYSYPLQKNYPVAKLENASGYFTLPTQYNVAVALTKAEIDTKDTTDPTKYLTQILDGVYRNADSRAYAMSSYSYMIIPTGASDPKETTAKRQTLADFLYYSLCQGQRDAGPLGYSPLPINLVQASFDQVAELKNADPKVDLTKRDVSTCNNPTFIAGQPKVNRLAQIDAVPPPCDKLGAGPCTDGGDPGTNSPSPSSTAQGSPSPSVAVTSSGGKSGNQPSKGFSGGPSKGGVGGPTSLPGDSGGTVIDPETGKTGGGVGTTGDVNAAAFAVPTDLPVSRNEGNKPLLAILVGLELVAILIAPPIVAQLLATRRKRRAVS